MRVDVGTERRDGRDKAKWGDQEKVVDTNGWAFSSLDWMLFWG